MQVSIRGSRSISHYSYNDLFEIFFSFVQGFLKKGHKFIVDWLRASRVKMTVIVIINGLINA
jgi:hypothetical protein